MRLLHVVLGIGALSTAYLAWSAYKSATESGANVDHPDTTPTAPPIAPIQRINPASPDNFAYQGASKALNWLLGKSNSDATVGTTVYDWLHPAAYKPPAAANDSAIVGQLSDFSTVSA